jgi:release factor glutamine methyltransferase
MADFHPLPSHTTTISDDFDALNKEAEKRAKECIPASMPSLDHLTMKDYEHVYEPSDDTFLLLDGIQLGLELADKEMNVDSFTALEIGCGTGIPIVYLGLQCKQRFQPPQSTADGCNNRNTVTLTLLATDCNPHALRITQTTAAFHELALTTHQCDLASGLLSSTHDHNSSSTSWDGAIDMLLFNPPYVPTPDEEVVEFHGNHGGTELKVENTENRVGIEASWAGGLHGRRVIDRAIPQIAQLLRKPAGVAYMITVDDNLPEQLRQELGKLGLRMEPWVRRRARNEYLTVQRITWM